MQGLSVGQWANVGQHDSGPSCACRLLRNFCLVQRFLDGTSSAGVLLCFAAGGGGPSFLGSGSLDLCALLECSFLPMSSRSVLAFPSLFHNCLIAFSWSLYFPVIFRVSGSIHAASHGVVLPALLADGKGTMLLFNVLQGVEHRNN